MSLASYQTTLPSDEERDWDVMDKKGLSTPLDHTSTIRIAYYK